MSSHDMEKWQSRYLAGAYLERTHPSDFLAHALGHILHNETVDVPPRALDLACGAGRNALFLASQGYRVDAVDIASAALQRGNMSAAERQIQGVNWIEYDLDNGLPPEIASYHLIVMTRYLDIALLKNTTGYLLPGGCLLAEVHLQTCEEVSGPRNAQFRAAPGDLKQAAEGLELIEYEEGLFADPDGSQVALARMVAKRAF